MMKKLFSSLLLGLSLVATGAVLAHGVEKPRHGGVVQSASDLSFELATQGDSTLLYVEDHGKPLATQGMAGKLTVLQGTQKSDAELKPAGDNKLEAKGVRLAAGAKAVAALTTASGKAITVRFTVR